MKVKTRPNIPDALARWAKISTAALVVLAVISWVELGSDFFITADQRGQRMMDRGEYQQAAETFADPFRQANAYYEAGDFEHAADIFGGLTGSEAAYNHGNALVMLGKYDDAITRYDIALESRPSWQAARINRDIAVARAERLRFQGGDMTGGQLAADEIVFDNGKSAPETNETETMETTQELSDEQLRAVWLRQVQTTPGEFLKAKFAYQLATTKDGGGKND